MASPTVDGSALKNNLSSASSGTITLSTTKTNDVIIVVVSYEVASGTVPAINVPTASGLTFTQRSASGGVTAKVGGQQALAIFAAPATSALSSKVITVSFASAIDDACIVAFGVNGCGSISSPWDTNASLPLTYASSTSNSAPSISGASTSKADDLLLFFFGADDTAFSSETAPTGFTLIQDGRNTGGANNSEIGVYYQSVSATQSSITITGGTAISSGWVAGFDALTADAGSNNYSQNISISCVSTLSAVKQVDSNGLSIACVSSLTAIKDVGKSLSISSISSLVATAFKTHLITLAISCVSSLAMVKQVGKIAPISTVSSLSAIKQIAKTLSISSVSTLVATAVKTHLLALTINCVSSLSAVKQVGKIAPISTASSLSLTRGIGKAISIASVSTVNAIKQVSKNLSISSISSVSISAIKAHLVNIAISCVSTLTASRSIGKQVPIACVSAVNATKAIVKNIAISCISTVNVATARFVQITLTIVSTTGVSLQKSVGKIVSIASVSSVSTAKSIAKNLAISCVSTVNNIIQSSIVVISKYARYIVGTAFQAVITGRAEADVIVEPVNPVSITGTSMTTTHDLLDFVCGTDWEFTGPLQDANGNPLSLTSATITWKLDSLDGTQNFITCDNGSNGGVSVISQTAATIFVDVPASKTTSLPPGTYRDWLIVTLGTGQKLPEWTGIIRAAAGPT